MNGVYVLSGLQKMPDGKTPGEGITIMVADLA